MDAIPPLRETADEDEATAHAGSRTGPPSRERPQTPAGVCWPMGLPNLYLLPRFREVALRLRPSLVGAGFHPAESIPDAMARDRLEHRVDQVPPLARRRLSQRPLERRHRLQCPLEAQVPWLLVMGLGRLGHHASDQVVSE